MGLNVLSVRMFRLILCHIINKAIEQNTESLHFLL